VANEEVGECGVVPAQLILDAGEDPLLVWA
jgi:hypothetical protein